MPRQLQKAAKAKRQTVSAYIRAIVEQRLATAKKSRRKKAAGSRALTIKRHRPTSTRASRWRREKAGVRFYGASCVELTRSSAPRISRRTCGCARWIIMLSLLPDAGRQALALRYRARRAQPPAPDRDSETGREPAGVAAHSAFALDPSFVTKRIHDPYPSRA